MKTIGVLLKEARTAKKFSVTKLAQVTKIKMNFIEAIESEDWAKLPDPAVTLGFVKSMAESTGISEPLVVATFRRDYPPKKVNFNPKPDIGGKFVWSPKLTFAVGVGIFLAVIAGYLVLSYQRFVSPPLLIVDEPREGQIVRTREMGVSGKSDADVILSVNNQPLLVGADGKFEGKVEIYEGTTEVTVKATSRSGKESVVKVKIKPELK